MADLQYRPGKPHTFYSFIKVLKDAGVEISMDGQGLPMYESFRKEVGRRPDGRKFHLRNSGLLFDNWPRPHCDIALYLESWMSGN